MALRQRVHVKGFEAVTTPREKLKVLIGLIRNERLGFGDWLIMSLES